MSVIGQCRRRWAGCRPPGRARPDSLLDLVSASLAIACAFLALWLALPTTARAHDSKPSPAQALLPACRVTTTTCQLSDLIPQEGGRVRPFPGLATSTPLDIDDDEIREEFKPLSNVPCANGFADIYPCQDVDLLAFLPVTLFGDGNGNTLWGWVDPETGQEYVIMGLRNGSAFVEITNPLAPRYVGKLPSRTETSPWRDMKVYADYAFIGSDHNGAHGIQIFDLAHLRTMTGTTPITLTADATYDGFGASHNLVINTQSGFLYAVGSDTCDGGLHMVDIRNPLAPQAAGCYSTDGYIHDAECVIYNGPDTAYTGRELCFNASAVQLTVVDVTDKRAPVRLSRVTWPGLGYVHQGWLTSDQRYLLVNDEFDERFYMHNAFTYVFDMADVEQPLLMGRYQANNPAIDHNLYISGTLVYEANYTSGLRILEMGNLARARLREVGYFDTYPGSDAPEFTGAWSPYPFFPSGVVAVSTIDRGLFLVRPRIQETPFEDWELFLPLVRR